MKIGFIGLGNMAGAMIGGLLQSNTVSKDDIYGSDANENVVESRAAEWGIHTSTDNKETVASVDYLVLAVKPQFVGNAIDEIRTIMRPEQVIISIVAGKSLDWMTERFDREIKCVRCMP
ncbi:MAG TPA: NAD(P)-binding domain-containing protein, partial [Lachnospiraceae bacterium]|nr:NAD(P)-binding domain-containing protein [Lachnospiraceae bacterium]